MYRCKSCDSKHSQEWTKAHGRNPIPDKEYAWRRQGIELSYEDFLALLKKQDYKCKICGRQITAIGKTVGCVDHNHRTGKIRGLLCITCNANLGWYEKYLALIQEYLNTLRFMVDITS